MKSLLALAIVTSFALSVSATDKKPVMPPGHPETTVAPTAPAKKTAKKKAEKDHKAEDHAHEDDSHTH
ncbi:MAG: hypothetical protein AB7F59_01975 [Bdellovibrionales bacterium]